MTKQTTHQLEVGPLQRSADITREQINTESRTVELAFSSELPVERWFGNEILDHSPTSVRLGRFRDGAPVLVDHDSTDHVGVIESVSIDSDRRGRVTVRFGKSARAEEVFQDVIDRIRRHVSVRYRIHKAELERSDGDEKTYRVTDWEPFEVSMVSIPADPSVGIGRSADADVKNTLIIRNEETKMEINETTPAPAVDVKVMVNEAREKEMARIRSIQAVASKFGKTEEGAEAIRSGKTAEQFYESVLNDMGDAKRATPMTALDLSPAEVQKYSLFRALNAHVSGDWSKAGFERECSLEIAERLGREAKGFFVPFDVQKRDMTVGTPADGGYLKGTDHLAGGFIEALRAQSVVIGAGARMLTGLVGDVQIPRLDGSAAFYWVAEDANVTSSDLALGQLALAPKTVGGAVPMSRRLLKQSSPSVEDMVLMDLIQGAALAIDLAALAGSGAAGQPTGIINTSGVNTQTITAAGQPTWAEMVGFETKVAEDNGLRGALRYITTAAVRGHLKTAEKATGTAQFLMAGQDCNGYMVDVSTQLAANTILFGNFNDVIIGMWGVLDVAPDTAAKAAAGGLVLRVFQDIDIGVRHAVSFCKNA